VLSCKSLDDAIAFVNARPKPLSLYFFSRNRGHQERVLRETSSGGGCINDVVMHFSSPTLPFGGVGESGMGQYRGRSGFDTFTHEKAFLKRSSFFDFWFRYAPYKHSYKIIKWLM
jgi:aldehyde dehydrogenase (NAD+)